MKIQWAVRYWVWIREDEGPICQRLHDFIHGALRVESTYEWMQRLREEQK